VACESEAKDRRRKGKQERWAWAPRDGFLMLIESTTSTYRREKEGAKEEGTIHVSGERWAPCEQGEGGAARLMKEQDRLAIDRRREFPDEDLDKDDGSVKMRSVPTTRKRST
jgi:hypothetical protein